MNVHNRYIKLRCGCGGEIFDLPTDWTCHYKYRGFWRTLRHILMTEITTSLK